MTSLVKTGDDTRRLLNPKSLASLMRCCGAGAAAAALVFALFASAAPGWQPAALAQPANQNPGASRQPTEAEAPPPQAPASNVIAPGDAIVTGFSGVKQKPGGQTAGGAPLDAFFIDLDGSSAQTFRLDPGAPPKGQLVNAPVPLQIKARDVGQVFGVALDDAPTPNVYLGATAAYGLQIIVDEGIGQKRVTKGQAGARFMPGQFGENGGPGGVWKVDGATGSVSVFATIPGNRGPGLGDIAYDPATGLFFASDFDTGRIYRIDGNGRVLDNFDHGLNGRPAAGLAPIADDKSAMHITYPTFDSENPDTWGLTQPERRVWGLVVHGGRLYYAVWSGPQVWSVGVSRSGFANDARLELQVAGGDASPVAHMTFDRSGALYLAQRGGLGSAYNYTVFARARTSRAIRYRHLGGKWTRDDYAIGFAPRQQNASGGVALGYGYDAKGKLDRGRCDATLWVTGDALRNDPARSTELAPGGPPVVHGLQGNDVSWTRPADAPTHSYFVDYDGVYGDAQAEGHVGSVAIHQPCAGKPEPVAEQHALEDLPASEGADCPGCGEPDKAGCAASDPMCGEPPCDPNDPYCSRTPCVPGDPYCHRRNLKISKRALSLCHKGASGFICAYRITVTNTGPDDYDGLIRVREFIPAGAQLMASGAPEAPCNLATNVCATPAPVHLVPNDSLSFVVRVKTSSAAAKRLRCHVHNRAHIVYAPSGSNANTDPGDDDASATALIPSNDCEKEKANLKIEKRAEQCVRTGASFACVYELRFVNTGPGDYRSAIVFSDTIPNGATATVVSPTFNCVGGPEYVCTSTAPVNLSPRSAESALIKVAIPLNMAKTLRCRAPNVAHISQPPGGTDQNTNPGDDTAMAVATITAPNCAPEKTNLKLEERAEPCARSGAGYTCVYEVRYANTGPGSYQGVISFTDSLPAGASATFLSPDFTCVGGPLYTCTSNGAVTLPPNGTGAVLLNAKIPLKTAKSVDCQIRSSAQIVLAPGGTDQNTDAADDAASATALTPAPGCTPQSPPEKKSCTAGLEFNPETKRCESALGPACLAGQRWNGESCAPEGRVEERCPDGSTGVWPNCKTSGQSCPPRWNWDGQRCVPISPQGPGDETRCPAGFEKIGGQCVKSQPTGALAPDGCQQADSSLCGAPRDAAPAVVKNPLAAERTQHRRQQSMRARTARRRPHTTGTETSGFDLFGLRQAQHRTLQQRQRQRDQVRMMRRRAHPAPRDRRRPPR